MEVDKDNTTWVLNILDGYGFLNKDIEVVSQSGIYSGSKIYLPIREASQPIEIKDPEVGDSLKVICIAYAGFGVGSSKVYPDFEISKTSQGVVIALRDNDLDVAVSDFGVEIKKIDGGLKLSSIQKEIEEAKRKEEEPSQNKMSALKLLDISLLEYDDAKKYFKELGEIKREIYRLPKEIRNRARLKLARFYLANNMIPEALGVLDIIALNDETIKENPMYATLQGVTNALLNRYEDALKWFNVKSLEGNEEAKIWKAYIDVIQNDSIENMAKNYDIFKKNITYIIDYPSKIKNKIALQGLKIAVSEIDENMANDYINLINTDGMRGHQKAGISYYKGLMNEFSGHFEEAFTLFNEVANGENLFYRALANREKLKLEYKLNRIDHKEVLRQLEKLRYSWRGDKFEFDVMNDLVDLYISHGKYNEALSLLKDMMGIFKEEANNRHVKQRMEEIFDNLYLKGDADKLSPVKAIGIYQNFKEITPSGEKGNEMIRRLADRMVSVDLLDQASDLLKNQVEHRLEGREKAIIGARLALINIMNNKPAYALKVIEDTDYFDISNNLKWQRKLIKAKALSEMGKKDEAIKLVENDDTNDAKLLKTEILWSAKRWDEVSDVLRGMIKRPVKGEALEKGQADILIDWITALRLAGREKVLLRVRENFEPYVKGTRYYDTFNLLTDVSDKGTAFTGLSDQIKSAEGFKSFMNSYVDKMKQDGLSQTIK
ncbi:MAG: hypothetical protein BWY78_00628 [Alphaproteobacteria bacterium ADurb.Bin438]|nr:MAG: hypothetical protein BWY78_00628 [Alphaproteobacteria bacterium ADurb.Bin438]